MARSRIVTDPPGFVRAAALKTREFLIDLKLWRLRRMGMDIGRGAKISLRADLDATNPRGVHIGDGTYVAFCAVVFSHDMSRLFSTHTYVGRNCFVGAHAIIMAGVRVGDECIVGAGSVVTKDVPGGSIVAGNPARIIRSGVRTRKWGILVEAYEEALALKAADAASRVAGSSRQA